MRRKTPFGLLGSRYFSHRGMSGHREWGWEIKYYNNDKDNQSYQSNTLCANMHILHNYA